jgi:hypothetical protein
MMTDSDYIPADERQPNNCFNGGGVARRIEGLKLSHVVADSVMHELANALRAYTDCSNYVLRDGRRRMPLKEASWDALARYDRLADSNEV